MATQNNVRIRDDLLSAVTEIARAEGKTPDEVIEDTTRKMLRVRGLRSFVAETQGSRRSRASREPTCRASWKIIDGNSAGAERRPSPPTATSSCQP